MRTDGWTFTLVTPDAVVGGHLAFVLDRLKAHGLAVGACRLLKLDWQMMGRVYTHLDNPPPSQGPPEPHQLPGLVMSRLYELAPACALVLRGGEDACAAMLRCKGATHPVEAAAGTIRNAGEHATFNLVHCPDDEESAVIELAYLVGADDARGMRAIAAQSGPAGSLVDVAQLNECLPAFSGPEALAFPFIANRLQQRVVQLLAVRCRQELAAIDALRRAEQALRQQRAALQRPALPAERLELARAARPGTFGALNDALERHGDPVLRLGIDALQRLYDASEPGTLEAIMGLTTRAVYLSELESVGLAAHAHTVMARKRMTT